MTIQLTTRRFAWYGRLSTKDKQDPTLSFPSQREACAKKAAEIGGQIVCDFTDQEAGRRDDRAGWSELIREAKEHDARRFDAVVIYATSRLSREMFHALAYERELARAGVDVYYALSAGDQTTPEGRLIRHMFQALDQFEVEKLGREVRRGQAENTRQGYRNGGRAPYGYTLKHQPHPDPRRARNGDQKSRLVPDPEQARVVVEIFDRYLSGWGYNEIVNHLNRPSGPPPPQHVDSKRNTAGKWSKTTIRSILENPVYTGRLYWNRLDFRAVKQGDGPLVRRAPEEWIEAQERHEPLIPEDWYERVQTEMHRRRARQASPQRHTPKRFYLLSGIVHCATGHNALRMQGKTRKENTYYACGYRINYGDKAAEALGHGKWQYIREDRLTELTDRFFATHIFGPNRITHLKAQRVALKDEIQDASDGQRQRLTAQLADVDQRIQRQIAAIEAGVDPALVAQRIQALKAEKQDTEIALAALAGAERQRNGIDLDQACAILDAIPDLSGRLAAADPQLRRRVYQAFRLSIELDRNASLIRLKALVSSAFSKVRDLEDLGVAQPFIAGAGFEPATFGL